MEDCKDILPELPAITQVKCVIWGNFSLTALIETALHPLLGGSE